MDKKGKWKIYWRGFCKGFGKAVVLGILFYRNAVITIVLGCIYGIYSMFAEKKLFRKKQKTEITLQFREGLQGVAAALTAGYSIENAWEEAQKDLVLLYGPDALLVQEFQWIRKQLLLNQPMEKVLFAFAERWQTEDILHFAQIFQTAKRTGGNLIAITRTTSQKISEKIEVRREIDTMIAGKKMEGRIMNAIPLGMILYFWICSPGFLDCMYISSGRIVMTVLLIVYIAAYQWSERISDIHV